MQFAIDCSSAAKPDRTGVARYCASLVAALPEVIGPDDRVALLHRISRWRRRAWFLRVDDPRFATRVFHDRPIAFGVGRPDVVHGADLRIPRIRGVPLVSTVHDLSAIDVAGVAEERFRRAKLADLADVADRAAAIVCVSEFTERAFLDRFPQAQGRTSVVPEGLPPRFEPRPKEVVEFVLARRGLRRPYLLFVGQIAARKNLPVLLKAWETLRSRPETKDVELVLAGPVKTGGDEFVAAVRSSASGAAVRFLGFVGDDELPALYTGAAAFCFPGKAEGFGIPILEATACGAPVVGARAGATPSTAGDAAVLVDPDDAEAWAAAIERVLADPSERAALTERGFRRAAQFTWAETARRTVEIYRDAARVGAPA